MLPVVKPDGKNMFTQVILFSLVLIPISLMPTVLGLSGWLYFGGALFLGLAMLASGVVFTWRRSQAAAKRVLTVSLVYLPALFILILVDAALF